MKKGIFHFHSTFSYDGLNTIDNIIRKIVKKQLDFVVLTDHDTIRGSIALQKKVKELNINVEIPIAAEYKTSNGDIITINVKKEIINMEWENFFKEAREQNAFLVLPHPYDYHTNVEILAKNVDAIEVYNSRSSLKNNYKSYLLAKKFNKPMIWSSDSHIPFTLLNAIISYNNINLKFTEALQNGEILPYAIKRSTRLDIFLSQLKKAITCRNYKLFIYIIYKNIFKTTKESYH